MGFFGLHECLDLTKYKCNRLCSPPSEQVFNQHDRSQLHHHFLQHLFHSASWSYIFLLRKALAKAQEGQYEFSHNKHESPSFMNFTNASQNFSHVYHR